MKPRQRDIVLVPVPFTDLSTLKRRPALVLSCDAFHRGTEDVVVAAITSQPSRGPYRVPIAPADLDKGDLPRASWVRADKIYTLNSRIVLKRFGRLSQEAFARVLDQIDALWGREA
jgi:mRNA interferase MazF